MSKSKDLKTGNKADYFNQKSPENRLSPNSV